MIKNDVLRDAILNLFPPLSESSTDGIIAQLKEEKDEAEKKAESLQGKIQNSGRLQIINVYLESVQEYAEKLYTEIEALKADDSETAAKLLTGIKAVFTEVVDMF